jgi:hypothetical protein
MKLHKNLLYANGLLLIVFGLWGGISAGSSGIGLALVAVGIINIFLLFIFLLLKNTAAIVTCLLVTGVTLLLGYSFCSMSSISFH